jgi:hypothetical protein
MIPQMTVVVDLTRSEDWLSLKLRNRGSQVDIRLWACLELEDENNCKWSVKGQYYD